jgi:hypothetical protein
MHYLILLEKIKIREDLKILFFKFNITTYYVL